MTSTTIILEGGLVAAVYADNPDTHIAVMDMDIEGHDPDDPQLYGNSAYLHQKEVLPYHEMTEEEAWVFQSCPVETITQLLPWWMQEIALYDGLEVHPVRDLVWDEEKKGDRPFHQPGNNEETCCEVCTPDEAHFWSVYGHLKTGGIHCFEGFPTREKAYAFAEKLLKTYPHLQDKD